MQGGSSRDIEIGRLAEEVFVNDLGVGTLDVLQLLDPVLLGFLYIGG